MQPTKAIAHMPESTNTVANGFASGAQAVEVWNAIRDSIRRVLKQYKG